MYPRTTCFFKALIKAPPKTSNDAYEVLFEDDDGEYTNMLNVSQKFVIAYPSSELEHEINVMKNDMNVTKNDMNMTENDMKVTENDMKVTENDMKETEDDLKVTENDMKETENDIICEDNMKCLHI